MNSDGIEATNLSQILLTSADQEFLHRTVPLYILVMDLHNTWWAAAPRTIKILMLKVLYCRELGITDMQGHLEVVGKMV